MIHRPAGQDMQGVADAAAAEEVYGEKIYDVSEAARQLEVDESTIRRHIKAGDIVAFKLGKKWRIAQSDLRTFVESLRQDRLEVARNEQLSRQFKQRSARLAANRVTAAEWGPTTCRHCTQPVLTQFSRRSESWSGTCAWCKADVSLPREDVKSFTTLKDEKETREREWVSYQEEHYSAIPSEANTHAVIPCVGIGCTAQVLLDLDNTGDTPQWIGVCGACGVAIKRPRSRHRSITEVRVERERRDRLRAEIEQQRMQAVERHIDSEGNDIGERMALVRCHDIRCEIYSESYSDSNGFSESFIVLHQDVDGETRWVGTCPFCNSYTVNEPLSALEPLSVIPF